jgi:hypothetical protein
MAAPIQSVGNGLKGDSSVRNLRSICVSGGHSIRVCSRQGTAVILLLLALHPAFPGTARVALASELDSLLYHADDAVLRVDFMLPVSVVNNVGIEEALDDHGLTVECMVTVEVHKWLRFGRDLVVKNPVVRTLRYSKFYDEYILTESGREPSIEDSYYKSLDRFRRLTAVPVIDLYLLEPGEAYTVSLEVRVRALPKSTRDQGGGPQVTQMGFVPPASIFKDIAKEWRKKGDLIHVEYESPKFTASDPPYSLPRDGDEQM